MKYDLAEALRRDDLWVDGDARYVLIDTVSDGQGPAGEPEVVLADVDGLLVQALCVEDEDAIVRGLVPLAFGPLEEKA